MSQSVPVAKQQPQAEIVASAVLLQFRQIYRLYCHTSPQGGCSCLSCLQEPPIACIFVIRE